MKLYISILALFLGTAFGFSQEEKKVSVEEVNGKLQATYYHDNGTVAQQGEFCKGGKLQGEWISYDTEGNRVAIGNYKDGQKVGKWFFWSGQTLKEVDFINSKIVKVNEWNNKEAVAFNR